MNNSFPKKAEKLSFAAHVSTLLSLLVKKHCKAKDILFYESALATKREGKYLRYARCALDD